MLNTILIADCDQCGQCFESLAIALDPKQYVESITTLKALLQDDGWHVFQQQYRCPNCVLDALAAHKPAG